MSIACRMPRILSDSVPWSESTICKYLFSQHSATWGQYITYNFYSVSFMAVLLLLLSHQCACPSPPPNTTDPKMQYSTLLYIIIYSVMVVFVLILVPTFLRYRYLHTLSFTILYFHYSLSPWVYHSTCTIESQRISQLG